MRVVLLMGASSVGKSTLCEELIKTHHWKSSSLDEASLLMERKSDLIKLKPELQEAVRSSNLLGLMSEHEILTLCVRGQLNISQGNHVITGHQFSNPELPGLETVLANAGFEERKLESLSTTLRKVADIGKDMPIYMLYDDVFSLENENETVVVDIFPTAISVLPALEDFQERAAKFQAAHPDIHLSAHTVLAYCPPQFLSRRIQERNQRAEQEGNLDNKRVGVFPFNQLATVLTAAPQTASATPQYSLTTDELFDIAKKHGKQASDASLYIEDPFDPSILTELPKTENSATEVHDGKVVITHEDDLNQPTIEASPRIGTAEQITQYRQLHEDLGFSDFKEAVLSIRHREAYDAFIDTSKGDAQSLATTLVTELDALVEPPSTPRNQL